MVSEMTTENKPAPSMDDEIERLACEYSGPSDVVKAFADGFRKAMQMAAIAKRPQEFAELLNREFRKGYQEAKDESLAQKRQDLVKVREAIGQAISYLEEYSVEDSVVWASTHDKLVQALSLLDKDGE
jgi:hypothetical protein